MMNNKTYTLPLEKGMFTGECYGVIRDWPRAPIMLQYRHDIYNMFLQKLAAFVDTPIVKEEDIHKLKSLLDEIIKVQELLDVSKDD